MFTGEGVLVTNVIKKVGGSILLFHIGFTDIVPDTLFKHPGPVETMRGFVLIMIILKFRNQI